jgi:hypothetical protein
VLFGTLSVAVIVWAVGSWYGSIRGRERAREWKARRTGDHQAGDEKREREAQHGVQGRLRGIALSDRAEKRTEGIVEDESEYAHEYISAATIEEQTDLPLLGLPQEVSSNYPARRVENHLNRRAAQGWHLVDMEPDWWWKSRT